MQDVITQKAFTVAASENFIQIGIGNKNQASIFDQKLIYRSFAV